MKEINDLVNQIFAEKTESGVIEELIRTKIDDALESAFKDLFQSYGGLGTQIKKGLEEALILDFSNFDLASYNVFIMDMIKAGGLKACKSVASDKFLKDLDEMLQPAPAEITVQELIQPFLDEWREEPHDHAEYATVSIEQNGTCNGYFDLKLWSNGKTERSYLSSGSDRDKTPDLELFIRDSGEIGIIRSYKEKFGTTNYGGDARIFQMYAAGTKVIDIAEQCDDLDLETYIYGD